MSHCFRWHRVVDDDIYHMSDGGRFGFYDVFDCYGQWPLAK